SHCHHGKQRPQRLTSGPCLPMRRAPGQVAQRKPKRWRILLAPRAAPASPARLYRKRRANMLKIVLITGISGSGKSVALRLLEDAGYTCVDNLPVRFLHDFIASTRESELERVAVAIDVRTPGDLVELPGVITSLRAIGVAFRVIFLDANDHTL